MPDIVTPDFGLYVHWPFCTSKCPYCDFNSHVSSEVDHDRWTRAFRSEISRVKERTGPRVLSSIFFGGGTPSLMPPSLVSAILEASKDAWPWSNNIEITLEANPTSIEIDRFKGFAAAGVNRVSMGVQALNNSDLRRLGRMHSVDDALKGLEIARACFDRVSIDLIYARQDQSVSGWKDELSTALDFGLDHMSLYQLTIEDGTVFGARHAQGHLRGLPDQDLAADMFDVTQEMTEAAGLPAYEISNHAAEGGQSRHNLLYWSGADWAGIGPGAHGRLTLGAGRYATETALFPQAWLDRVETAGSGETVFNLLVPQDVGEEYLMMGLRTVTGINLDRLLDLQFPLPGAVVSDLVDQDLLWLKGQRLGATATGRPVLNHILRELMA